MFSVDMRESLSLREVRIGFCFSRMASGVSSAIAAASAAASAAALTAALTSSLALSTTISGMSIRRISTRSFLSILLPGERSFSASGLASSSLHVPGSGRSDDMPRATIKSLRLKPHMSIGGTATGGARALVTALPLKELLGAVLGKEGVGGGGEVEDSSNPWTRCLRIISSILTARALAVSIVRSPLWGPLVCPSIERPMGVSRCSTSTSFTSRSAVANSQLTSSTYGWSNIISVEPGRNSTGRTRETWRRLKSRRTSESCPLIARSTSPATSTTSSRSPRSCGSCGVRPWPSKSCATA